MYGEWEMVTKATDRPKDKNTKEDGEHQRFEQRIVKSLRFRSIITCRSNCFPSLGKISFREYSV